MSLRVGLGLLLLFYWPAVGLATNRFAPLEWSATTTTWCAVVGGYILMLVAMGWMARFRELFLWATGVSCTIAAFDWCMSELGRRRFWKPRDDPFGLGVGPATPEWAALASALAFVAAFTLTVMLAATGARLVTRRVWGAAEQEIGADEQHHG